jgi:hypothetical protein
MAHLNQACQHRFVERFDWLSNECLELMSDMRKHQAAQRTIKRNEILQAATAKRQAENERKGVLFSSRRAKWEKDTESSRLQKQSNALKDEHAQHSVTREMISKRRTEMLESLNKLPNLKDIRLCSSGIYRRKKSGAHIWDRLGNLGETQCHGWDLSDILQVGHLLPPMRSKT